MKPEENEREQRGRNLHEGHRERLRRRFAEEGLDAFDDHTALELLLSYAIPRRDVNTLAHELIRRFGSFDGVFDAPLYELAAVSGVGERSAVLIKLVPQLARKYQLSRVKRSAGALNDFSRAGSYFLPYFYGVGEEQVYLATLDPKCRVIGCHLLGSGREAFAAVTVKSVLEAALRDRAFAVILAHNHPNGVPVPSRDDIKSTEKLAAALEPLEIKLSDHIIVADNEFASLKECGYM